MPIVVGIVCAILTRIIVGRVPGDQRTWWLESLAFVGSCLLTTVLILLLL